MKEIAMFFYKINSKLEKIKFLTAIKQGYTILMPIFIIGAFSILLQYFPLFLVKDFNSQGKLKFDNSFMTNADTPAIAFKGIVDNPINPYTNKPLILSDKENGVLITTDDIFMVHHSKSNNIFTVDKNKWFRVKDNIFKDENWTKEEVN